MHFPDETFYRPLPQSVQVVLWNFYQSGAGTQGSSDRIYEWLKRNGPQHGFIRTVSEESWHWEYRPAEAATLAAQGKFKLAGVNR